jgi:plasmid stability protein
MADVLIRNLEETLLRELESVAKAHGRSLETEIRRILDGAAKRHVAETRRLSVKWRNRLQSSSSGTDGTEFIRHERV